MAGILKWSEKHQRAWTETRKRGKWRFVLVTGVLVFGGCMLLVSLLLDIPHMTRMWPYWARHGFPWELWALKPMIWVVAGMGWGLAVWAYSERKYALHEKEPGAR